MAVFLQDLVQRLIMQKIIRLLFIPFTLLMAISTVAQISARGYPVQQDRKLWHDNIDKEQKRLLALDGKADEFIQVSKDDNINLQIADVMIRQVDLLQEKIELDSSLTGQMKIKNLRSLQTMLLGYNNNYRKKDYPPNMAPALFDAFVGAMQIDRLNMSIEPVISENSYGVGKILVECFLLPVPNSGVKN